MNYRKLISLSVFFLLMAPFGILFLWAFTQSWSVGEVFPDQWGLRGWFYLFNPHNKILASLGTSILLSLLVTFAATLISIPAGKALGLYEFPGKTLVELLILAPIIIPPITVGMGIHVIFIKYGLTDTFLGVMLVHLPVVLPYGIRIFASIYKALGHKWEEQGRVLKANSIKRFIYITLPFLRPGLISGGILMFNVSFSQYFLTFLIGGGKVITLPILLFPYVNSGDRVLASTISLIFIITALLFMFIVEKVIKDQGQQSEFYYL